MSQENNFADRLRAILATVTSVAAEIEKLIAASGLAGMTEAEIEKLTLLFGNLAAAAIQAAHDAMGKEITPDSVLALMPISTALVQPSA